MPQILVLKVITSSCLDQVVEVEWEVIGFSSSEQIQFVHSAQGLVSPILSIFRDGGATAILACLSYLVILMVKIK